MKQHWRVFWRDFLSCLVICGAFGAATNLLPDEYAFFAIFVGVWFFTRTVITPVVMRLLDAIRRG